jgi:hypothetical protein
MVLAGLWFTGLDALTADDVASVLRNSCAAHSASHRPALSDAPAAQRLHLLLRQPQNITLAIPVAHRRTVGCAIPHRLRMAECCSP